MRIAIACIAGFITPKPSPKDNPEI